MTDRELLELAAKAAEIAIGEWNECCEETGLSELSGSPAFEVPAEGEKWNHCPACTCWNPLTNDGDALRLAVKLEMNIFHAAKSAFALPSDDDGTYEEQVRHGDDPYAATRRAIVRAAAEIGKSK